MGMVSSDATAVMVGVEGAAGIMNSGGSSDDVDATGGLSAPCSVGVQNGALPTNFSSNLRKSLLKSEQAKSTCSQMHLLPLPPPMGLRNPSPSPAPMALDEEGAATATAMTG
jgi:hypothetical protein